MIPNETRAKARRSLVRSGVLVAALCLGYALLPLRGELWWIGAAVGLGAIIGIVPITIRRFHAVRRSEEPVVVAIEAVVLLVTMLVLGFAAVYYAIDANQGQFDGLETKVDSVYFTVTTLSTVGYGDIHAAGTAARVLVTINIMLNLAFLGVVVRVMAARRRRLPDLTDASPRSDRSLELGLGHLRAALDALALGLVVELLLRPAARALVGAQAAAAARRDVLGGRAARLLGLARRARSLLTVRAAISSAVSSLSPRFFRPALMWRYWRSRFLLQACCGIVLLLVPSSTGGDVPAAAARRRRLRAVKGPLPIWSRTVTTGGLVRRAALPVGAVDHERVAAR